MAVPLQVTFDCADPDRLATFWAAALDYEKQRPPEGYDSWQAFLADRGMPEDQWNSASAINDPSGNGPRIYFQRVPEPKAAKNRVHLDVNVGGGHRTPTDERRSRVNTAAEKLVGLGATIDGRAEGHFGEYWIVMRDPEGNEFCVQ
ncbi:MAG: VOC family protein [Egibacteraceae bacterium]